jgi:phosphoribosylamine--glycine ligase
VGAATAGDPAAPPGGARLPVPSFGEGGTHVAEDAYVYWAGVREREEGVLETTGGRVYTAVGLGDTLEEARQRAYATVERLPFEGRVYRRDIAHL